MDKSCETCQRKDKRRIYSSGCLAFIEKPDNCWAWTDDKDWLRKVKKAVEEYKAGRFVRNED